MRKEYHKLIRDRIPDIIRDSGRECGIETMPAVEYRVALLRKLVEEATEAAEAEPEKLKTELADLYEVIDAIMAAYDLNREAVLAEQRIRHVERGGFEKRLRLLWTE
jgi:predicted house-cleaning noncanonical NTP pyrophosphatase (MazG superfamily)